MRPDDFVDKWASEARAMQQRSALVQGAVLLDEILRDFDAVIRDHWEESLNLTQAVAESGYSADYLGRLVKNGTIPNTGRPNAPRIQRANLPRKAVGGRGSSRWGSSTRRERTDEGMPLHVSEVVRVAPVSRGQRVIGHGAFSRYGPFSVVVDATDWPISACVKYELEGRLVVPGDAILWLLSTQPNFGGHRWWFVRPPCGRRCSILYFRSRYAFPWSCRVCLRLVYACQAETQAARLARRLRDVLGRAGGAYRASNGINLRTPRPNGMHQRTFKQLSSEADRLFMALAASRSGRAALRRLWE